MNSNYKNEEIRLKNLIDKNIKPKEGKRVKMIIYYKTRNVKNLFIKNSTTTADLGNQHHVVYQYKCTQNGCNSIINNYYIGYTTTTLESRMTQHQSIKKHFHEKHGRTIGYKEILRNIKILHRASTRNDLAILEALNIKEHNPLLNNKEEGKTKILKIF